MCLQKAPEADLGISSSLNTHSLPSFFSFFCPVSGFLEKQNNGHNKSQCLPTSQHRGNNMSAVNAFYMLAQTSVKLILGPLSAEVKTATAFPPSFFQHYLFLGSDSSIHGLFCLCSVIRATIMGTLAGERRLVLFYLSYQWIWRTSHRFCCWQLISAIRCLQWVVQVSGAFRRAGVDTPQQAWAWRQV